MAPRKRRRTLKWVLATQRRVDLIETLTEEAAIIGRVQAQVGKKMVEQLESMVKYQAPWERVESWRRIENLVNRLVGRGIEDCEHLLETIDG